MKKITIIIFLILALIIWFLYFWEEYKNQIINIEIKKQNTEYIEKEINNFNIEQVKELSSTQLYYTPYRELLDSIVKNIDNAETKIYISSYIFTEKRIKNALIRAKKRWLETKVIMEKDPYMAYNINDNFYNELIKKDIEVKWSNQQNYLLNHAKFMIIDNMSIISTWNISYSTFQYNRDFFVITKDQSIVNNLETLFINDFNWIKTDIYHSNILLSPNYSRSKINKLLSYSKNNIKIYMQYFNDNDIVKKLIDIKKTKNVNIEIIISKSSINNKNTKKLIDSWIIVKTLEKNKMHSKAILIDNEVLFIWSINFSKQSIDENRELWILLKNKNIISKFNNRFYYDFKN